jgi:glycosyltransferase involved in cell wall biosynthesis
MLMSVFTPTNDPKFLPDTFSSLLAQTYEEWEWVICPNGKLPSEITEEIRNHPKVRVIDIPSEVGDNIGALKRFACDVCRGNVFIELDHDDLLTPTCLADVKALVDKGCGFVYSDAAVFNEDMTPRGYDPNWGWELYPINVYGKPFLATKTFPITARTLCEVYFAPDHVRCWTRKAYYAAGGHDPALSVGDDHELIVRTYLAGVEFGYTDNCGYLYRNHEKNTVKLRNAKIQETVAETRRKYLHPLIAEWCKRAGKQFVDIQELLDDGFDWEKDTCHGLPFEPEDVGCFKAFDVLQYMPGHVVFDFFNHAWRSLTPGGWVIIEVPSTDGRAAFQDPSAISYWNRNSFLYYTDKKLRDTKKEIRAKFQSVELGNYYPSDWHQSHDMKWLRADLFALKDQRHPGRALE